MKLIITLLILLIGSFGISSASLTPYQDYEGKLDIVFEQIDGIIANNDGLQKSDVFSAISSLLRQKHTSGTLSEKHNSLFAYMLAYYNLPNDSSLFMERSQYIYDLIGELDYYTCELDRECEMVRSMGDLPGIPPSVNLNYINIVDKTKLLYLPATLPVTTASVYSELINVSPICVESYCATEYKSRTYKNIGGEKEYTSEIRTNIYKRGSLLLQ